MAAWNAFRVFVDGSCAFCRSQGEVLRWLDDGRGRIVIEDITAPEFDPNRYGLSQDQVMREIHGVTWDGRILRGMDVFRKAYDTLGFGLLTAPTGWPFVRPVADMAYHWFSRNRHLLSSLPGACSSGTCQSK
jgi:predicted DCC family thiol-disulfide oxidoreductase YuxK